MDNLKRLYALTEFCFSKPIDNLVCNKFWITLTEIFLAILVVTALFIVIKLVQQHLEFRANQKLVEHRKKVADPETMAKHTWKTLEIVDEDTSQQDLAEKFRSALKPQDQ